MIHNTFCHEREMKEWEWQAEPNSFFARITHNFLVAFITLSIQHFLRSSPILVIVQSFQYHFCCCCSRSLLQPGFSLVVLSAGYCLLWNMSYSYCSWGSQGKNTEVVCHSLLWWTMLHRFILFFLM